MSNLTKQKNKATFQDLGNRMYFVETVINYATELPTAADTYALFDLPVGAVVLDQRTCILVDASGTLTVDIGDEDTANLFDNDINMHTTAGTWYYTTKGTDTGASGKGYSASKEVRMLMNHAVTTGKAYICMLYAISDNASSLV